jgi:hypothetical protein
VRRIEVVGTIEEGCRVPLDEPVPVAVDERARFIVLVGEDEPNAQVMTPRAAEVQGRKPYRSNRPTRGRRMRRRPCTTRVRVPRSPTTGRKRETPAPLWRVPAAGTSSM